MPQARSPRESSGRRNEHRAIEAVIRAATSGATLIGYPEQDGSGPAVSRPCDALYRVIDEQWAVEHTTVDIYRDERLARARFVPLAGPLECALTPAVDYLLMVSVPAEPLQRGLSWVRLVAAMTPAILAVLPRLNWDEALELSCLGVPVLVSKDENDGIGQVYVARQYPSDVVAQRTAIWQERIADKRDCLAVYHEAGYRTVLVLETEDIGNRVQAARKAFTAVSSTTSDVIDDVWAVMTATSRWLLLPLKEHGIVNVGRRWIDAEFDVQLRSRADGWRAARPGR